MTTIYNAAGEAKECDAVDAREHIATGRWFAEVPAVGGVLPPIQSDAEAQVAPEASARTPDASTDAPKRGRK